MLDLTEALKATEALAQTNDGLSSVLFYQSEHCKDLVNEVFRYDTLGTPNVQPMNTGSWESYFSRMSHPVDLVMIELTDCVNVIAKINELAAVLPNTTSVVVIGTEDAISTIRSLKEMGFYYLFWPVTKAEMSDFLRHVCKNHRAGSGLGKERSAKRIAVIGAKGGVGCTLIACELATFLRRESFSRVMLVDHGYADSNLDVMMRLDAFNKLNVSKSALRLSQLDEVSAQSLLHKAHEEIAVLALDGLQTSIQECYHQTSTLVEMLLRGYNLVVEDLSASREFPLDYAALHQHYDTVVLVIDPTVSAVRSAKRVLHRLDISAAPNTPPPPRVLVVLNQHRTFRDGVLYRNEIEQQLKRPVDLEVAYEKVFLRYCFLGSVLVILVDVSPRQCRRCQCKYWGESGSQKFILLWVGYND